jgi:Tol biopolymer transport system component
MKKSYLLLLLSLVLSLNPAVKAQGTDALLLVARYDKATTATSVYVLNAQTGEERLITDSVEDAGWTPDGRVWVVDMVDLERRLRFFDVASGEKTTFEEPLYHDPCFASLVWSPDGERLAYITGAGDERVLKILNLVDGSRYELPSAQDEIPQWSPGGRYFLVNVPYMGAPYHLYAAADGQELLTNMQWAYFSADGLHLLYTDEGNTVWWYDLATGNATEFAKTSEPIFPRSSSSGQYTFFSVYPYTESLPYYDRELDSIRYIEPGYPVNFAAWGADENHALLYANDGDTSVEVGPITLLSYDLTSGESNTLLTDTVWVGGVYQSGGWTAIRYSLTPPENPYSPTTHLLLTDGDQRLEAELLVGNDYPDGPSVLVLDDGRGFVIASRDGLYHFDPQTVQLDLLAVENTNYPFLSPDGTYLAFGVLNAAGVHYDAIWNTQTHSLSRLNVDSFMMLSWRGANVRSSLLYCGEG